MLVVKLWSTSLLKLIHSNITLPKQTATFKSLNSEDHQQSEMVQVQAASGEISVGMYGSLKHLILSLKSQICNV